MARALPGTLRSPSLEGALLLGLFVTCVAYSLMHAAIGWGNTLLGWHGFRQTQTAFTTYCMLQGGPWLVYETPVLGVPWAIPFEFPLYQWAVALAVKALGMPLDQTGRLVGELFFYATLVPAYMLLRSLQVRAEHRWVFLSLLVVSPQYIYWSRSFMIESTAVFCAMSYLAFAVRALQHRPRGDLVGAVAFGALAAMVKMTTFFVFLLAAGLYLVHTWWQTGAARLSRTVLLRVVVSGFLILPLPTICGVLWTQSTESVRMLNPVAASFLSTGALQQWYFGTAAQRLSSQLWLTLLNRTLPDVIGHGVLAVASVALLIGNRRHLVPFVVCVALFLSAPLTFTNLHIIHNYYAYGNGVFLIAAVSWCSVSYLERADQWRWLGVALLASTIGASLWRYQQTYVPAQRTNVVQLMDTATAVQGSTAADDVVLVLGLDWSPELPYYARRRSLMNRDGRPPQDPIMQRAMGNLSGHSLGAMVVCAGALRQRPLIESWLRTTGLSPVPRRTMGCEIYTRPA